MTARLSSLNHVVSLFGAVLFTAAFVVYSTPVLPIVA
jgi:hypothetical protein